MLKQQCPQSERVLDYFLHAGGALGLAAIASIALWLAAAAPEESTPAHPERGPAAHSAQLRAVHAELVELDNQLKAAESRVQELSRRVPQEPRESEFLKDIMGIAGEAGLTIRDYQPALPIAKAGCRQLPIHLFGSGNFRSICQFLDRVSRLPRLTTIEKLEIAASPAAASYPIAVTVAVYYTGRAAAEGKNG